jgi:hypothetical protein
VVQKVNCSGSILLKLQQALPLVANFPKPLKYLICCNFKNSHCTIQTYQEENKARVISKNKKISQNNLQVLNWATQCLVSNVILWSICTVYILTYNHFPLFYLHTLSTHYRETLDLHSISFTLMSYSHKNSNHKGYSSKI